MYVRQHYNLAVSGKLGQKLSGKGAPTGGSSTHGKSMKGHGYAGPTGTIGLAKSGIKVGGGTPA